MLDTAHVSCGEVPRACAERGESDAIAREGEKRKERNEGIERGEGGMMRELAHHHHHHHHRLLLR